jgi:hypothetical protein
MHDLACEIHASIGTRIDAQIPLPSANYLHICFNCRTSGHVTTGSARKVFNFWSHLILPVLNANLFGLILFLINLPHYLQLGQKLSSASSALPSVSLINYAILLHSQPSFYFILDDCYIPNYQVRSDQHFCGRLFCN